MAFALLAVMALAAVATMASLQARRSQQRAEEARAAARLELGRALLADIRAIRQDKTLGRKPAALATIRRAAAMAPSEELRHEAAAALALPDFTTDPAAARFAADPAVIRREFDRDLRWCASGRTNGDVVIHAVPDGRELARLRMEDGEIPARQRGPGPLEFSPDGARLAVRYQRGGLTVWDWRERKVIFRHDLDLPHSLAARGRFSSDGRVLVGPVFTPRDGLAAFDVESGRMLAHFADISSYHHVAVRPGHTQFAAHTGTNVAILDWTTQARVAELDYGAGVRLLNWSRDGRLLVIVGNLLEVHVWDFDRRERRILAGHKNDVFVGTFDPTGDRLATAAGDGTSRLWDLRDGRLIGVTSEGWLTQWGRSNRMVLETPDGGVEIRHLAPSPVHRELVGPGRMANGRVMDVSPDGRWAASAAGRQELQIWDLDGDARPTPAPVSWLRSLTFQARKPELLVTRRGGTESTPLVLTDDSTGPRPSLGPATLLSSPRGKNSDLMTISADGGTIAWVELAAGRAWIQSSKNQDPAVMVRDLMHNSTADRSGSSRGGGTISLSPDGRWLACGVSDSGVAVFDAHTGDLVRRLARGESSVQFSHDGRWLAAAGNSVDRVYRVADWVPAWESTHPRIEHPAVAISPDGTMLAATKTPSSTALRDVASGRELVELQSPEPAPVMTLRWSDDGRRLVAATRENHIQVWEPSRLRAELGALHLDWGAPAVAAGPLPAVASQAGAIAVTMCIFAVAGLVGAIALLALRRHHRLLESYADTEALAARRERELAGEREVRQMKDTFVSMVSHEFRTPLGIIQSSAQILDRYLDRLPSDQRREQVTSITRNVRRMAGLIDEVLVLGKVEAGQLRCVPAPADLPGLGRRLIDEVISATAGRCPIQFEIEPMPMAQADEALLRHILTNLLSNAVKYSPGGQPVRFRITRKGPGAEFTIRDEGIGIPAADRASLFTAFHRGANVGQIPGTGLGLTIVKRCVELHGGELECESEEGRGTTFRVRLPLFPDEPSGHAPSGAEEEASV